MSKSDIDPLVLEDIRHFRKLLAEKRSGKLSEDDFAPERLKLGVYGQRTGPDQMMFRIKVPYGGLNPAKLRAVARIARELGGGKVHLTTRQNLQIHHVPIGRVEEAMWIGAGAGLFTREACGNTIRTIIGCPFGGVCRHERFDPTPYAHALTFRLLRRADFQNMPRKFKISFTACPQPCPACGSDEPVGWIHDLGFQGDVIEGRIGFRLWIGGGLGNTPKIAFPWPEVLTAEWVIPTTLAVLRLFNQEGNRKVRARARMKFVVDKLGREEFVRRVLEFRKGLRPEEPELPGAEAPGRTGLHTPLPLRPGGYRRWFRSNVRPQKQTGYSSVIVAVPIGDATADQIEALADLAETFAGGRVRTMMSQNFLLRWVRNENLAALYSRLVRIGLGEPSAGTILDVTSCPGASTCKLAFTHSKNLGVELRERMAGQPGLFDLNGVSIKISGCPNACGQHHVADIGFYGVRRVIDGREVPAYQIMIGGGLTGGLAAFGRAIGKVPARVAPIALRRILDQYREDRFEGEPFQAFVERLGIDRFKKLIEELDAWNPNADIFRDVGVQTRYVSQIGRGECAR